MTNGSRLGSLARAVLRTQTDERLVSLAREGHETAFEEIVRRYRPGLVAFAAAFAPPDRVEDVVQESLVRAWGALGQASEEIHLKAWLYTIVRNRALNARRDAKTHAPLSEEIDGVPQPPDVVLRNAELAAVVGAVNALPEPQRAALVRSAVEGHTHDQIADALGSSVGAVRQLIYRARLNLRTGLGLMIPLPLVRLLVEHGGETAAAGGVAAGGTALGAAGGASVLAKVATVAAIGTIAAGAGVAIEQAADDRGDVKPRSEQGQDRNGPRLEAATATSPGDRGAEATSSSEREAGDDPSGGSGDAGSGDDSGPSESSGPGGSGSDSGDSGSSSSSGTGSSGSGDTSGSDGGDHSGSGDGPGSGDTSGPSDSSGPGSGGTPEPPEEDNSGPGGGGDDGATLNPPPEEDNSGPGGGGDDDLLDPLEEDHSGPGGGGEAAPESPQLG